jgi:hypothetical protein
VVGLAAMKALSDAEAVAEAVEEVWDDDAELEGEDELVCDAEVVGEDELVCDAEVVGEDELVCDAEVVGEDELVCDAELAGEDELAGADEAVGEGDVDRDGLAVGVLVGLLLGLGVVVEPLGDGDGEGEGFRDGLGEGDGEGDGVLNAGSSWQVLPVLAEAGLAVAVTGLSESACAVPDEAASAPKITGPPASKLSVVARTCPERTNIALSTMLVTVTVWSS